ncbi:MAG TPA: iron-sulfur cluster assembly protein [Acidobacteriaceae bacterium]|nr:iron-sulfur cluster assembly protein [Acidobacteriaceae bacterium]
MRAAAKPPLTEADVLAALRDCYEPEIRANIVELGLVQSISVAHDPDAPGAGIAGVPPRHRIHIGLTLPYPGSDMEAQVIAVIENRLAAFPTVSRTHVEILPEPRWTPDRVAPELRERLSRALASNQRPHALIQIQTARAKSGEES